MRRKADPEWGVLLNAMRRMQRAGTVGMRMEKKDGRDTAIAVLPRVPKEVTAVSKDRTVIRNVLNLDLKATEFNLTYGLVPRSQTEIALMTRSMFEVMVELATGVQAPDLHVSKGWVRGLSPTELNERGLVVVKSGAKKPEHSFAAIRYRDHWFWIENNDLKSKGTVTLLNFFFNLSETGGTQAAPVVTISAGSGS